MATKFEFYDTARCAASLIYQARWAAQVFTPSTKHSIEYVKLRLYREGLPTAVYAAIRNTTAGLPSGANLAVSNAVDCSAIAAATPGELVTFTLTSPIDLESGSSYAVLCYYPGGSYGDNRWINFCYECPSCGGGSNPYGGGKACWSTTSGASWVGLNGLDTCDYNFEEWGTEIILATGGARTAHMGAKMIGHKMI